ncbi:MAG TPA: hypothetical protein VK152_12090, partial [Paludibacter sp.]|nr:hypothetical protein [Paludibacter sp.]
MKKILDIALVVAFCTSIFALTSCEDMLTVDSNRYATVDQNPLSSTSDTVSTVLGLLKSMQKIGDRYILLGEMRADLLDVTPYTSAAIRQLSNYTVDSTNTYANPRDYYSIINNCNYFISRTSGAGSPLKSENALVHAIRAWTYMQIAINWGKAQYYTQPLLTVEDTKKNFPVLDIATLTDSLIADLEPYRNAAYPNYGKIYEFNSEELFLPMKLVLGDLYLWRGRTTADFENAATCYAGYIDSKVTSVVQPQLQWSYENYLLKNFETESPIDGWSMYMGASSTNEMITAIQMATVPSEGITSSIPSNNSYFKASRVIDDLWDDQVYYLLHEETTGIIKIYPVSGDLR